jgi:hypothetical protein
MKMLYNGEGYSENGVGLAYISGYFLEYLKRKPRIEDSEVIDYFKNRRLKSILLSRIRLDKK